MKTLSDFWLLLKAFGKRLQGKEKITGKKWPFCKQTKRDWRKPRTLKH